MKPAALHSSAIKLSQLSHTYSEGKTARRAAYRHPEATDDEFADTRQNTVLNNLDAVFGGNQVLALLGQSGSGKSTLLNLISGLEPIQSGNIQLFGESLARLSDQQRTLLRREKIGFVYQSFNLIPTLTVAENISLPLALNNVNKSTQTELVQEMLEQLGLGGRQDDFPDRLSGGEQQRVAIARAMVHKPDLVLADEPTGNLDSATGRQVLDSLLQVVEDSSRTLLLVTHSREVAKHASEIWTLESGKLLQKDSLTAW